MSRTLEEWIKFYEEKTKEKFVRDKSYELFYLPDKGFCEIFVSGKMVVIKQLAGDGRFWKKFAEKIARRMDKKVCGSWFIRKELFAYIKLFGFKITETEKLPDGSKRYHGVDNLGRKGLMSPAFELLAAYRGGRFVQSLSFDLIHTG